MSVVRISLLVLLLVLFSCGSDEQIELPGAQTEQQQPEICLPSGIQLPTEAFQSAEVNGVFQYFLRYQFEYDADQIKTITQYEYETDEMVSAFHFEYIDDRISRVVFETAWDPTIFTYSYTENTRTIEQKQFLPEINDTISLVGTRFYIEEPVDGIHLDPTSEGRAYLVEDGNFVKEGFYTVTDDDTTYTFQTSYTYDDRPNVNRTDVYSYALGNFTIYNVYIQSSANNLVSTQVESGEIYDYPERPVFDDMDNLLSIFTSSNLRLEFSYSCE